MSHSYSGNRIHLVFSTKNREKQITEELQQKLWPYMAGIAKNHGFEAIKMTTRTFFFRYPQRCRSQKRFKH
jgi:REP element-mobilizing transposase RayT